MIWHKWRLIMATKIKEECIYAEARLVPYEGTNAFKIGTSMCTGCGVRVNSESGEPVEGVSCPINNRMQVGINAETSQEMIVQIQNTVDAKVEAALEEERLKLKNEHDANVANAKQEAVTAKQEALATVEELKALHAKELKAQQDKYEEDMKDITEKHNKELAAANAPKASQKP